MRRIVLRVLQPRNYNKYNYFLCKVNIFNSDHANQHVNALNAKKMGNNTVIKITIDISGSQSFYKILRIKNSCMDEMSNYNHFTQLLHLCPKRPGDIFFRINFSAKCGVTKLLSLNFSKNVFFFRQSQNLDFQVGFHLRQKRLKCKSVYFRY